MMVHRVEYNPALHFMLVWLEYEGIKFLVEYVNNEFRKGSLFHVITPGGNYRPIQKKDPETVHVNFIDDYLKEKCGQTMLLLLYL